MPDNTQDEDKLIACVDCGAQFSFSARDQAFYQQRGVQIPRRCRTCRDKRKSAQGVPGNIPLPPGAKAAPAAAPGSQPAQYKVNCSFCGNETTVPFKPDPNRPVYCRTCYLNRRKSGTGQ